ncbi:hypothetical protein SPRG_20614 [Saprolegnia parasitica CBS 223.65]|uniref:ATP-dependent DNA helicase n=1 Tax=Saprolegnia parasitica (strain CBS 223.65) TaxID=695850 RepID=A0A067C9V1_SAPPC|nr:hypothetical protein SPRG_20614 [Saprolegnia parasitica CBS 223.65]KDO25955.1 hypothetical protein SPRG_20614 [Saprolegnia parasitica CBS 223.65]|eukprot:XP_012203355.1 hypothetical protein SPRG_20614 [Saprolegnia parasitica CBS 223.65]
MENGDAGYRCDLDVQVASTATGQRKSSKSLRGVRILKRAGGLQVLAAGAKMAIRTPSAEVYFSQIQRGKMTFIKRDATTFTQYNLFNGTPDDLIALRDFALTQGAVSKTTMRIVSPLKTLATTMRAPLSDRTNHVLKTPSPSPAKKLRKRRASSPPRARALASSQPTKRSRVALTSEQQEIIDAVARKENVFFTGRAGTGKSYLLRQLQKRLPQEGLYSTATTGIAAYHIHGMTLHHFAGLSATLPSTKLADVVASKQFVSTACRWRAAQILIVDEISMLDGDLFELLEGVARKIRKSQAFFGGIQLILSGDFYQLPPVTTDKQAIFCFEAPSWDTGIKATFSLNQVFRQKDPEFITILNAIREGTHTQVDLIAALPSRSFSIAQEMLTKLNERVEPAAQINPTQDANDDDDAIHIFTHNADVLQVLHFNTRYLFGCPVPTRVVLKKNAKVMLTKTISVANGLVNGSRGVILGFTPGAMLPFVRFTNGISQVIPLEEFGVTANDSVIASRQQVIPLTLAYGISIHKSQGLTFDRAILHLGKVFEYGQAYVALSRISSLQGTRF